MKFVTKSLRFSHVALVALVLPFVGAGVGLATVAEEWDVEESVLVETVRYGLAGRALTVTFAELTDSRIPRPSTDILVGGASPASLFSGDLLTPGYSGLRFRVAGDGSQPKEVDIMTHGVDQKGNGRSWIHSGVSVSSTAGAWTVARIPLDPAKGWTPTHTVGARFTVEQTWAEDLADVHAIFVRITRAGLEPQVFSLADFKLVGGGAGAIKESAQLSLIQDYFNVDSYEDIDKTLDSNGDGMSDYDKLRAGLDPHDANSIFAAEMAIAPHGNTVLWPGVLYGNYAIMRATDLRQGFQIIGTVRAVFTGTQSWMDQNPAEGLPNFYKVVKY